jgi:predicted ATPase
MADWKALVRTRLTQLRLTASAESDLADELAQHLEDRYRELRSGGASEEEAHQRTIAELEDMYPIRPAWIRVSGCRNTRQSLSVTQGEARMWTISGEIFGTPPAVCGALPCSCCSWS